MTIIEGYELGTLLGFGGFGETYQANKGGQEFAFKLIKEEAIAQGFDANRFRRECRSLEKVLHKNVVKIIEYGQTVVGKRARFYLVMELLKGSDFEEYLQLKQYRLQEQLIKTIFLQVVDGLEAMHIKKIWHRDIKPKNVFITADGTVKLLDFGLVKMVDYSTLTLTGEGAKGTPMYISPEAIRGEDLDHRCDFYSLGVMLYYVVTGGKHPFEAQNLLQLINMVLNEPAKRPTVYNSKISNELENFILMLLNKQPFARIVDHKELKTALQNITFEVDPLPRPKKRSKSVPKQCYYRLLPNEKSILKGAIDKALTVDGIEYVANYVPRYKKSLDILVNNGISHFFDPATNRLPYSTFSQTQGLVDLPYCWDKYNRLTCDGLRDIDNIQKYIKQVIDWQAKWKVNFFLAPFHFHRSLGDPWLETDLKLLSETLDYCKTKYKGISVFAGICCNMEEYTVETNRIALLNRFSRHAPDGFIFYGDEISESATNPARLYAYMKLIKLFGRLGKKVIGARLGTLGLGVLAAGADIITTGIASLTGFSENNLLQNRTSGYKMVMKYYVPELMLTLPVPLVQSLISMDKNLACNCSVCAHSSRTHLERVSKLHYISVRGNEIETINSIELTAQQKYFVEKTRNALDKCKKVAQKVVELRTSYYSHLNTWIEVFEAIRKEDKHAL